MGYVNEINTDFFTTSEFFYLMSWNALVPTQEDIWKLGVYEKNNAYCRDFDTSIGTVQARMFITETGDGQYRVSVRGLVARSKLDDWINAATKAMGFEILGEIHPFLATAGVLFDRLAASAGYDPITDTMEFLIDAAGKSVYDKNTLDLIYNYFQETYAPMDNPYIAIAKTLPDGQSTVTEWDNSLFSEESSGIMYEWNEPDSISYKDVLEQLRDWSDKDDDIKAILQCPNIRTYVVSNELYTHYSICGWTFDNNNIVTSTVDGHQTYGLQITSMKWVRLVTSVSSIYQQPPQYPTMTLLSKGSWTGNQSITINNLKKNTDQLNLAGLPFQMPQIGGIIGTFNYWDSLGFSVTSKPYKITGVLTTPNWGSGDDVPVTVIDDGDPEEKTQPDYQTGDVPPNVKLPVPPVKGNLPKPYPDEDSPETIADVDGIQTLNGLFWVWDLSSPGSATIGQVGGKLWDPDVGLDHIFDKLAKQFNNEPLQAIISLHQLYALPTTAGSGNIFFGTWDSELRSNYVMDRYIKVECGTRTLRPYFNDVRDYQTEVSIYLPFIGIRELNINEVLNSILYVDYFVDVFTGDCIANISILRGGHNKKTLYMFNGNCASQLPLTAADRTALYGSVANLGVGAVNTILNPASAMSLVSSAANMATSRQISIEKTGSLGGNHGAMMFKKPYLIISRPQPFDAVDRGLYEGMPTNVTATIGKLTGFVRVKSMHVESIPYATDEEKQMILSAMQQGVIL